MLQIQPNLKRPNKILPHNGLSLFIWENSFRLIRDQTENRLCIIYNNLVCQINLLKKTKKYQYWTNVQTKNCQKGDKLFPTDVPF